MPRKNKKRKNKRKIQLQQTLHNNETNTAENVKMFDDMTNDTALLIMPPQHKIKDIENIRITDDKWYERVLPHITLLWPFVNEKHFAQLHKYLQHIIESNKIQAFPIELSSFDYFDDETKDNLKEQYTGIRKKKKNKKKLFLFLKPSIKSTNNLRKLFDCINKGNVFGKSLKYMKYNPHLSVGQYNKHEIKRRKDELNKKWKTNKMHVYFMCDKIHILCQNKNNRNKLETRFTISLQINHNAIFLKYVSQMNEKRDEFGVNAKQLIFGYLRKLENECNISNSITLKMKQLIIDFYPIKRIN